MWGYKQKPFFSGGIALICLCGVIDSVTILLMVPGHTKFAPDLVAQHNAGGYNLGDTFNHAHLRKHVETHASSIGYDGALLETWKAGTIDLFGAIEHIMSYRLFLTFRNDGQVNLGPPVHLSATMEPFPDAGPLFDGEKVEKAMSLLSRRSLVEATINRVWPVVG